MRRLVTFILALASIGAALAQADHSSVFVYRTDGEFDAFYLADVDSITFSKVDLEGVAQDEYQTQLVWRGGVATPTPILAINNVGFLQPETVVSSDLFILTSAHDEYVVVADTLGFTMNVTTPAAMRPVKGNVVVAEADCHAFPNGIMARVTDVAVMPEGYVYTCEAASLDDVYDQIVFYGIGTSEDELENGNPAGSPRRISQEFSKEIWNKTFEGKIDKLFGTTYYANDKATCELKVCKTLGSPLYASIKLTNEFAGNIGLEIDEERDYAPDPVQIGKTLKVGRITFPNPVIANLIWLEPQISFFGYVKAHGKLDVNVAAHLNRTDAVELVYSDRQWSIKHTPTMDAAVDAANLSMSGYVEAGLRPEILLALNGSATGIGINGHVGVKQTLDFAVDGLEIYDKGAYENLKDTHTDTYLTYSTNIFVQAGLFGSDNKRKEYKVLDREKMLLSMYLFPLFGETGSRRATASRHEVTVEASRDVILPVSLGMYLYDEEDNLVQQCPDWIPYEPTTSRYSYSFSGLDISKVYKAYPIIRWGDRLTLRATPGISVNKCPAQIDHLSMEYAYFNRNNASAPNTLVFGVNSTLESTIGVEEWGVKMGNYLYPFQEVSPSGVYLFGRSVPDDVTEGNGFLIDYDNYVFEADCTAQLYCEMKDDEGNTTRMYSEPFTERLRYDEAPRMTYANPTLDNTEVIGSSNQYGITQYTFRSTASYDMSLRGTFWVDYILGGINGNFSLDSNPMWQPTYNGDWRTTWTTTYLSTQNDIPHSNWHNLHLRHTGRVVESDYLNWHGGNGVVSYVDVSPSPNNGNASAAAPALVPARLDTDGLDLGLDETDVRTLGAEPANPLNVTIIGER